MFSPLKIFIGLGTVIGTGGAGLAGTYVLTKKTILDGLENKRPVSTKNNDASDAWTKLVQKLKSSDSDKLPKSEKFNEIKTEVTGDDSKLKPACEKVSEEIYSTIFYTNDALLNDFKLFCVISLGDMIDSKKFTSDASNSNSPSTSDKATLKTKLTNLQNHTNSDGTKGNLEEDKKLNNLKSGTAPVDESDSRIAQLFQWCKDHYESSYVSDSDNLKKLVYSYCQKD